MKTKHLFFIAVTATSLLNGACSDDYPDEWGFVASFQSIEGTIEEASLDSYNLQIRQSVSIENEGVGINKAGFLLTIEGEKDSIPVSIIRNNGFIYMDLSLPKCLYGKTYVLTPYIGTKDFTYYGSPSFFNHSTEEFNPIVSDNHTYQLKDDHTLTVQAEIGIDKFISPDKVEMKLANVTLPASINGNRATSSFDLRNIDMRQLYSNPIVELKATNQFGEATRKWDVYQFISGYFLRPSTSLFMQDGHILQIYVEFNNEEVLRTKPSFNITYEGKTKNGHISTLTGYYGSFDIEELGVGDHSGGLSITISNVFGESSKQLPYIVQVKEATGYNGDGSKGDYVQLGGVKWAPGNLVINGGKYQFQSDAVATDNNYYAYGLPTCNSYWSSKTISYGNHPSYQYLYPTDVLVQGIVEQDAATAQLGGSNGWVTPRKDDYEALVKYSSRQWYGTGMLFRPIKNGKQFVSSSTVNIIGELKDGLCLPACGYRRYKSTIKWNSTRTAYWEEWSGTTYGLNSIGRYLCADGEMNSSQHVDPYEFSFTSNSVEIKQYDCHDNASLRPIKTK